MSHAVPIDQAFRAIEEEREARHGAAGVWSPMNLWKTWAPVIEEPPSPPRVAEPPPPPARKPKPEYRAIRRAAQGGPPRSVDAEGPLLVAEVYRAMTRSLRNASARR